ncbi:Receptor protein kinase [Rhynchospora pubera]|nr:Receptor protein kinase [Rhynchospora pubera]
MACWQVYRDEEMLKYDQYNILEMAGLPTRFTVRDLETATQNFQTPIGEGASGAVFKGTLADGSTIAVKRIKWQQSGETEFRTEITIIASLQHVNLVRLLGYCISTRRDRYLIYQFFENGSLDAWLFKDDRRRSQLKWLSRYQIATDVAKALSYLHHECHHRILHLDIKPANILLDRSFRAMVSDFGISKLIARDESSVITRARGTIGYLAPEMLVPNAISTKSDVYSYGMVLLELIGGRRNFLLVIDKENQQRQNSYFPKIVREKMMQGKVMEVVDQSLARIEEISEEEVSMLVRLALWCIQGNPELRPSMTEVVEMLEGRMPVHMPPESSMYVVNFLDGERQCSTQAREDDPDLMSANTLSISIQSGR